MLFTNTQVAKLMSWGFVVTGFSVEPAIMRLKLFVVFEFTYASRGAAQSKNSAQYG